MRFTLVLGAQYGDEGKGKIVDFLSEKAVAVARFNGGSNAGHTVVAQGLTYKLHLMPSGAVRKKVCCLGSGMAINPKTLAEEIEVLRKSGKKPKLKIDSRAQMIMPYHILLDGAKEKKAKNKIGTTKRGIGPCYADRASRTGIRFGEFVRPKILKKRLEEVVPLKSKELALYGIKCPKPNEILKELMPFSKKFAEFESDVSLYLHECSKRKKQVLLEGAQGFFLDNDFGSYPFVTSSHPTSGGAVIGTGISHKLIGKTIGIAKAYCTRVGEGPFITEIHGKQGETLRKKGNEYGTTTGRPRRVGWLDLVMLRTASRASGLSELVLTKLDVLSGTKKIKVCFEYKGNGKTFREVPANTFELEKCRPVYKEFDGFELPEKINSFEDLPAEAKKYLKFIEKSVRVPIKTVSFGPDRKETITR